jgi:5-methylcytosine-specific restriction protein A
VAEWPDWCTHRRPGCHGRATGTDTTTGLPVCSSCLRRATGGDPAPTPGSRRWGQRGVAAKVRSAVLDRDAHRCQLRYAGCIGVATEADHIENVAGVGVTRDVAVAVGLMQAVCAPCHKVKTKRETSSAAAESSRNRAARRRLPVQPHPGD